MPEIVKLASPVFFTVIALAAEVVPTVTGRVAEPNVKLAKDTLAIGPGAGVAIKVGVVHPAL